MVGTPAQTQQILRAEGNARQRAAKAIALDIVIQLLARLHSALGERERQRVVARPELLQALGKCARQFLRGDFFRLELLCSIPEMVEKNSSSSKRAMFRL